ncbi:division/cell wall cluster transcriptional repressor MraZ [Bacteroidales bacterium OttesenSCG-928-B11]|nr:division/cell wall cluster transcriptional repressor MraZ [Bacteroidales bacterium OttesenSCG-928-C03]MDL2311617.1 division/cell wall cluster transcriptional repressor MraZ [Bacteroidales bacterium OttesenSCG-928-B11]
MAVPRFGYWEATIEKHGRLKLPSALIKALPEDERKELWITHGFGKHIMLWTASAFDAKMKDLDKLNPNEIASKKYRNAFLRNLTHVDIDAQDRFVIPKPLLEAYNVVKDVVLVLAKGQIELWDLAEYNAAFAMSPEEFAELNQDVEGKIRNQSNDDLNNLLNSN